MDQGQCLRDRGVTERAEPSPGSDWLTLEPSSNDIDEQAVDEPRDDQLRAASRIQGFVAKELKEQLKRDVTLCIVCRQMDQRRKQRCERMGSDVLEQILCAEHHGRLMRARGRQTREA